MYSPADLPREIGRILPDLHAPLHAPACEKSLYRQVDVLSHYVADKACDREYTTVKRALNLLDELYREGNRAVRSAIENVFVFSLSATLLRTGNDRKRLQSLIPVSLFTLYLKQVLQKGC